MMEISIRLICEVDNEVPAVCEGKFSLDDDDTDDLPQFLDLFKEITERHIRDIISERKPDG